MGAVKIFIDLSTLCIYLFWVNFIMAMYHLKYALYGRANEKKWGWDGSIYMKSHFILLPTIESVIIKIFWDFFF